MKLTGNPVAVSKYHAKEENYYFIQASGVETALGQDGGAGQSHVLVYGGLAVRLGFAEGQRISEAEFTNLLSGKNARGEKVARPHKVCGIDLTFSAPKSVSVAGLLTERDPRLIAAHDQAVLETMREIEGQCAGTKPTCDTAVKTGNLAFVTVRDGFNRDHDPHLHTHVVVANMTAHGGKIYALDGKQIMIRDFNKVWGAMYRTSLAAKVKELGYSVSYTKKGEWRLDAVSLETEKAFSRRTAEIEAQMKQGLGHMDAWRKTRKEKDPAVLKHDVVAAWRDRAGELPQRTTAQNREAAIAERDRWFKEAAWSVEAKQELAGERGASEVARWQNAVRRATDRSACVSADAVITEYLTELGREERWEPITYAAARQGLLAQVQAGNILTTDEGRYTTWELARADRECILGMVVKTKVALPAKDAVEQVRGYSEASKAGGGRALSALQQDAAVGILASDRGLVIVQGDAGAGKTTMLKAVQVLGTGAGWDVVGVAVQGVAARKLQEESGIASTTLTAFLAQERAAPKGKSFGWSEQGRPPDRRGRLIAVDEASMLDSRGLSELLQHAERAGDKVVLVGDRNQLQSVGAGKPFERLVVKEEGEGRLLNLSENYRQKNPVLLQAVSLAREGRMRESLDLLDSVGKLEEWQDAYERRLEVAKQYSAGTLILTGTRESRDVINGMIRDRLKENGALARGSSRRYALKWADEDGVKHSASRELAVGERVTFLENEYKTYDVRNGEVGTVTKTAEKTIGVRLEDGREIVIEVARYGALDYGYALTTYKSQGQTYDRVVVEADTRWAHLQDQRNSYVQITRAREEVKIYTDDREALKDVAGVLSVKQDTLDLKESLVQAAHMERKVREAALGLRAAKEAQAKITRAGVDAQRDARQILEAATGASGERPESGAGKRSAPAPSAAAPGKDAELQMPSAPPRAHYARDLDRAGKHEVQRGSERHVHNQALVDYCGDKAGCLVQFKQLDENLRQRPDLSVDEKALVAEHLSRPESLYNLEAHILSPDTAIAAALVVCGARDFDHAAKGLSAYDEGRLRGFLDDERLRNRLRAHAPVRDTPGTDEWKEGLVVEEAARELREAQATEKAAAAALTATKEMFEEASRELRQAGTKAEKAHFWDKGGMQDLEKAASHNFLEACMHHHDAESQWRLAADRLDALRAELQARSQEVDAWSAEAVRRGNFHGTRETEATAKEAACALEGAERKLNEAHAEHRTTDRHLESLRHMRHDRDFEHEYARRQVWKAEELVKNARLWDKKEARAAEHDAKRDLRIVEKRVGDADSAWDATYKELQERSRMVRQAEKVESAAQVRHAEATRINDVQATRKVLGVRGDLTAEEQQRVSKYLGSPKAAKILSLCNDPQEAIAIGCVNSGVKNLKEATKDLSPERAKTVTISLKNEALENARTLQREHERSLGLDRGLSL